MKCLVCGNEYDYLDIPMGIEENPETIPSCPNCLKNRAIDNL